MASLNQIVSEIVHAYGQPNNIPFNRNIRESVIHAYNEVARKSFGNHGFIDKSLQSRITVDLINCPDGEIKELNKKGIVKRSKFKVPKPTRMSQDLPFNSVRTVGTVNRIITFAREGVGHFYNNLRGCAQLATYDYINGHIYVSLVGAKWLQNIEKIVIEYMCERPYEFIIKTHDDDNTYDIYDPIENRYIRDDEDIIIPDDMVSAIKSIIASVDNLQEARVTNEIPQTNLVK